MRTCIGRMLRTGMVLAKLDRLHVTFHGRPERVLSASLAAFVLKVCQNSPRPFSAGAGVIHFPVEGLHDMQAKRLPSELLVFKYCWAQKLNFYFKVFCNFYQWV